MIRKISSILLLFAVCMTAAVSCKKSERQKAALQLRFQTTTATSDYLFTDYFTNGDGIKIRVELLQFYISNVRFVTKKDKEVVASEIALVKCGLDGIGITDLKIPAGDYKALRFGIGVPKEMNEADPSEFNETGHPLNVTENTYWGMNGMYRFLMLDGYYDVDGDASPEGTFSYHTGYEGSYREVEFVHDFSFDRKGDYEQEIGIDVSKLFYVSGSMVDVQAESNYHGSTGVNEMALCLKISDNFANTFFIP